MPAMTFKGPDGKVLTAFICGLGRTKWCKGCGQVKATKLCDYPVAKGKTCDAPICNRCATSVGPDLDYCPKHKGMQPPPPQGELFEAA